MKTLGFIFWLNVVCVLAARIEIESYFGEWVTEFNAKQERPFENFDIRRRNHTEADVMRAETAFEVFASKVLAYVNWTTFEVETFREDATILDAELTHLIDLAGSIPRCWHLSNQLGFCVTVFQGMAESARQIAHFEALNTRESELLTKLCILKVRKYALFDSVGRPRYTEKGFAFKVSQLKSCLKDLKEGYRALASITEYGMYVFTSQAKRIKEDLRILQQHSYLSEYSKRIGRDHRPGSRLSKEKKKDNKKKPRIQHCFYRCVLVTRKGCQYECISQHISC